MLLIFNLRTIFLTTLNHITKLKIIFLNASWVPLFKACYRFVNLLKKFLKILHAYILYFT